MYFQILKLILWPRNGRPPRELQFEPGMVNVISGASKSGKSAVIPIIDYCLAARSCSIPVGVVRDKCEWFGIIIDTLEGQKLLARREPGSQQLTSDMYVVEGGVVEVPGRIEAKNSSDDAVRTMLDRLSGLTQLDFEANPEFGYKQRPSFRDLTAFTFQPQNTVANPAVLFYKADTTEHREKLKTVLPYVLNAVSPKVLALKHEQENLSRRMRRLKSEFDYMQKVSARKVSEGRTWLYQARELGVGPSGPVPADWPGILSELKAITSDEVPVRSTTVGDLEHTLERLAELRARERELVGDASTNRQRLVELRRLQEGSSQYGGALRMQRDRLALSTWMRTEIEGRQGGELFTGSAARKALDLLCATLKELEGQLRTHPLATSTLDAEYQRQRSVTESVLSDLAGVRQEIKIYEATSELAESEIRRTASVDRFLGGLQEALVHYVESDESQRLAAALEEIRSKLASIQDEIHETRIQARLHSALNEIQQITGSIVSKLNVEWGGSPVRLNPKELTVQVSREGRNDYLWEIGSGANWLAYHVAVTLALHLYFIKHPPSPVPNFVIYDQPSQVYFPKLTADAEADAESLPVDQEDVQAVRSIFKVMGEQVLGAEGLLQVIVLDHAHREVWGDLPGITLAADWWASKLVPADW